MASTLWQAGLGMSERMSATMTIMSGCKRAFPTLVTADLQRMAKAAEEDAFNQAASKGEYRDLCCRAYEALPPEDTREPDLNARFNDPAFSDQNTPVEQIGPYKATHYASGICSTVYRAISQESGQAIAIKLTTPSRMSAPHNSIREARLFRLSSGPAIIPLLSSESIAGGHFLLLFPFLPYELGTLLHREHLPQSFVVSHLHSLFKALEHIHSQGILHRDIKPSNILLAAPEGPAYLADFGIAWHADDPDSEPADDKITDVGTTSYRAPELLFGHRAYNESLDLWAAGCVVAEALRSGESLFDAGDLGSELALLRSIFTTLGTPNDDIWPEAVTFPDWGKMQFTEYAPKDWSDILPDADSSGIDLVGGLVKYQTSHRTAATDVLKHPFFRGIG